MVSATAQGSKWARWKRFRQEKLRGLVVTVSVVVPVVLAVALLVLALALPGITRSQQFAFVGTGLLAIGALMQVIASSDDIRQHEGRADADAFSLAGWMTVVLGAGLSFVSVIAAMGENPPVG